MSVTATVTVLVLASLRNATLIQKCFYLRHIAQGSLSTIVCVFPENFASVNASLEELVPLFVCQSNSWPWLMK
jgi:hypothetical protein